MKAAVQPGAAALPHANSYLLPGTRIIAGEYPFALEPTQAWTKLCRHLDTGIDVFLDLTEEGELLPYESVLREEARVRGKDVLYERHPIRDMSITTRAGMERTLDAMDAAQRAGRTAYVHCWGGIGRTGTVVGCFLVRHGLDGETALRRVGELFGTMSRDKLRRFPEGSPQTEAQRAFVRGWAADEQPGR